VGDWLNAQEQPGEAHVAGAGERNVTVWLGHCLQDVLLRGKGEGEESVTAFIR
jgi:hypothetical protein